MLGPEEATRSQADGCLSAGTCSSELGARDLGQVLCHKRLLEYEAQVGFVEGLSL